MGFNINASQFNALKAAADDRNKPSYISSSLLVASQVGSKNGIPTGMRGAIELMLGQLPGGMDMIGEQAKAIQKKIDDATANSSKLMDQYDLLGAPDGNKNNWHGPAPIETWPSDPNMLASKRTEIQEKLKGFGPVRLPDSAYDLLMYRDVKTGLMHVERKSDIKIIDVNGDEKAIASFFRENPDAKYVRCTAPGISASGQIYKNAGSAELIVLVRVDQFVSSSNASGLKELELLLYSGSYVDESRRLQDGGMNLTYDAYQVSYAGIKDYSSKAIVPLPGTALDPSAVVPIADKTVFSVADASGKQSYYMRMANDPKYPDGYVKLDSEPVGIVTGLPGKENDYGSWINATNDMRMNGVVLIDSDYSACKYSYDNGGKVGFSILPAQKIASIPLSSNNYPPGTLVQTQDNKYYRVTGSGQNDFSEISSGWDKTPKEKKGTEPDLSDCVPGDIVYLPDKDNSYYLIGNDSKPTKIDYPLQKFVFDPSKQQVENLQGEIKTSLSKLEGVLRKLAMDVQKLNGNNATLYQMISSIVTALSSIIQKVVSKY